jgi:hypothetical protein
VVHFRMADVSKVRVLFTYALEPSCDCICGFDILKFRQRPIRLGHR